MHYEGAMLLDFISTQTYFFFKYICLITCLSFAWYDLIFSYRPAGVVDLVHTKMNVFVGEIVYYLRVYLSHDVIHILVHGVEDLGGAVVRVVCDVRPSI